MSTSSHRRSVCITSPIPTGMDGEVDPTEAVFNANLVTEATSSVKDWRPMSSISQPGVLQQDDLDQDLGEEDLDIREESGENSPRERQSSSTSTAKRHESSPQPKSGRYSSTLDNYVLQRRTLRQPCKYKPFGGPSKGQHKSFITMTQRNRTTFDGIKGIERVVSNSYGGDRICRPYSTYSVSKSCERLAISPYGGPLLPSAVGRYREHYQSRNPPKLSKAAHDALNSKFQKFYINQDLIAITQNKLPAGVLKKPPPPKVASKQDKRSQNSLHRGATERMNAVQTTLGWKPPEIAADGKRFGVAYQVAMELSHNLDKHRKARSANVVPEVPPPYQPPISDKARLNNQSPEYLTSGEIAIRQSIKANQFDPGKPKREPTKFVKKRPPSPPLSKLSRDKFLPEALRRREEMEKGRTFSGHSGLRLGKTTGISFADEDTSTSHAGIANRNIERTLSKLSFQSDDGTKSDLSSHPGDLEDNDLMIRGQSARHSPRSEINIDPDFQMTTTPRCSPVQSRATTAKSKPPVGSDESEDEEANSSVIANDTNEQSEQIETKDMVEVETIGAQEEQGTGNNNHDDSEDDLNEQIQETLSTNESSEPSETIKGEQAVLAAVNPDSEEKDTSPLIEPDTDTDIEPTESNQIQDSDRHMTSSPDNDKATENDKIKDSDRSMTSSTVNEDNVNNQVKKKDVLYYQSDQNDSVENVTDIASREGEENQADQ